MSFVPHPPYSPRAGGGTVSSRNPFKPRKDHRSGGRLPLAAIGFIGLFYIRLRARVQIVLTKSEIASFTSVYNRSGMGMNNVRLIKEKIMAVGAVLSDDQVRDMLHRVGYKLNLQGCVLTLDQWLRAILHIKRNEVTEAKLSTDTHNAFSALGGDDGGGGVVDAGKFRLLVKDFDLGVDVDQLIANADTDGSGKLEYDEFVGILTEMFGKEEELSIVPLPNQGPQKTSTKRDMKRLSVSAAMKRDVKCLSLSALQSTQDTLGMLRALTDKRRPQDLTIGSPLEGLAETSRLDPLGRTADAPRHLRTRTSHSTPHNSPQRPLDVRAEIPPPQPEKSTGMELTATPSPKTVPLPRRPERDPFCKPSQSVSKVEQGPPALVLLVTPNQFRAPLTMPESKPKIFTRSISSITAGSEAPPNDFQAFPKGPDGAKIALQRRNLAFQMSVQDKKDLSRNDTAGEPRMLYDNRLHEFYFKLGKSRVITKTERKVTTQKDVGLLQFSSSVGPTLLTNKGLNNQYGASHARDSDRHASSAASLKVPSLRQNRVTLGTQELIDDIQILENVMGRFKRHTT